MGIIKQINIARPPSTKQKFPTLCLPQKRGGEHMEAIMTQIIDMIFMVGVMLALSIGLPSWSEKRCK